MDGSTYLAYDYPLLGAFWTTLWIFLWIIWLFLLFRVFVDLFRDDQVGGWAKAGWTVFLIVLPFLGVFVYLLLRGRGMGVRELRHVRGQQEAVDTYIRETAGTHASEAEQLEKLSRIHASGKISDQEFSRAKERVLH